MVDGCGVAVQAEVGSAVAEVGRAVNVTEKIKERTSTGFARFALLRASLQRKEESLFCVFAARLKPWATKPNSCGSRLRQTFLGLFSMVSMNTF
jgi:hypothetical protein